MLDHDDLPTDDRDLPRFPPGIDPDPSEPGEDLPIRGPGPTPDLPGRDRDVPLERDPSNPDLDPNHEPQRDPLPNPAST